MTERTGRRRPAGVSGRQALPSSVRHGPLGSIDTIYELPNGQRCVVTFANRGADVLTPVRNNRGELWVGHLLPDDVEPAHFDDWEREWVPAELLRPVSEQQRHTSEYLRELIRRDRQAVAEQRLRNLIADGLESGDGRPASREVIDELRQRAFADGS